MHTITAGCEIPTDEMKARVKAITESVDQEAKASQRRELAMDIEVWLLRLLDEMRPADFRIFLYGLEMAVGWIIEDFYDE